MTPDHINTILVVENESEWQRILTILCRSVGYHVVSAVDANEAFYYIIRLDPPPILALVDLHLPSSTPMSAYDGVEVLTACRDNGLYSIVVSSRMGDMGEEERDKIRGYPEVLAVVDKYHFHTNSDYANDFFIPRLQEAVAYAEAARHAEGQSPKRQECLRNCLFHDGGG
jgi:CheY-like chemotaxis protein